MQNVLYIYKVFLLAVYHVRYIPIKLKFLVTIVIVFLLLDAQIQTKFIRCSENRTSMQASLTSLCAWARKWQLKSCHLTCVYTSNSAIVISCSYALNEYILWSRSSTRDLGITIQSNLKPGLYCTEFAGKANTRSKLILKSFLSHNQINYVRTFVTYVRNLLEYYTPVWKPFYKCNIDIIKNVQHTLTRKVFYLSHLPLASYDNRLAHLGLECLELHCCLMTALILTV